MMTLYHASVPTPTSASDISFSQWFARINGRLKEWYRKTGETVNLREKIEFHELHYQLQMLRLNRPSPRNPDPNDQMRGEALKASIAIIREYGMIDRLGKLFYLFHAANTVAEAGICLPAAVLVGLEAAPSDHAQLAGEDPEILCRYIHAFPSLLSKVGLRWPDVAEHASILKTMAASVVQCVQYWLNGDEVLGSRLCQLKQELDNVSQFSPFPKQPNPTPYTVPGMQLSALPEGLNTTGGGLETFNPAELQFQATWTDPVASVASSNQLATYDPFQHIQEPFVGDETGTWTWDFSGADSEMIFAGLLDGFQPSMV